MKITHLGAETCVTGSCHLYAVEKFQDHQRLLDLTGPAVIIAGSGMCKGGRIVNHLKHGLFFVGYQAQDTP